MPNVEQLEAICDKALEAIGFELVDIEFVREPQGWVLRLFIDHPHDGPARRDEAPKRITHGDCSAASRHLGTVLDVEDPIDRAYSLELSSPGVLRPLRKLRDFKRFVGFEVQVQLTEQVNGRRKWGGRLEAADDDTVTLRVVDESMVIPRSVVRKARLNEEY